MGIASEHPEISQNRRVLFLACCATMSMIMGLSSVAPMIPMLAREFGVGHTQASLVLSFFTLPGVIFAIPVGILADRVGRKALLVPSFFLFGIAGTACAFTSDFNTLLLCRAMQGMGGISLGVLNTTILADTWSGKDLTKMIGYNMLVLSACTAIYPAIGGALAWFNWHYVFFLPVFAIVAGFVAIGTPLKKPAEITTTKAYLRGLLQVFQNRALVALFVMTLLTFIMLYGPIITCFPLLADNRFDANSAMIGLLLIFSSLGTGLVSLRMDTLIQKFSYARVLFASQGICAIALLILLFIPGLSWALLPLFLYGVSQGLNIPVTQSFLLETAPPDLRAFVMALNGMLQRVGQAFAPAGFSTIAIYCGIEWGFYAGIVLTGLLSAIILLFIHRRNHC